ncbi:MAG: acyl-CoA desaturase [Thermoleophilia bacterium]|nr:acyl-CoA desaturase [Thermoleophilia bacterium]
MSSGVRIATLRLFRGGGDFQHDLKAMVAECITDSVHRNGRVRFYSKAVFMVIWWAASWGFLMFVSATWWQTLLGCLSLAFAMGGIGFGIQHDANHGALGRRARWMGFSLDVIGSSSFLWRERHNHAHHTYTNVVDKDGDIDQLPFARFAPDQKLHAFHRFQHIYMFALYGAYAPKAIFWGDFNAIYRGPKCMVPVKRPRGTDLVQFIAGKAAAFSWLLVIPMFFHPWWQVLIATFVTLWILGIVLAIVFQLAHCVEEAEFTSEERLIQGSLDDGPREWTRHQVESTVDFGRRSRVLNWYLGGLNFQIEHHLLPQVCHVHYRMLSPHFEELCATHGFRYTAHPTLFSALKSHSRWLKRMGQPGAEYMGATTL